MNVAIHLDSTRHTTGSAKNCPDSSSASSLGGFLRVAHGTDFLTQGVKAAAVPGESLASTLRGTEADLDAVSHILNSRHITITTRLSCFRRIESRLAVGLAVLSGAKLFEILDLLLQLDHLELTSDGHPLEPLEFG
jgi:hypothetical protein